MSVPTYISMQFVLEIRPEQSSIIVIHDSENGFRLARERSKTSMNYCCISVTLPQCSFKALCSVAGCSNQSGTN